MHANAAYQALPFDVVFVAKTWDTFRFALMVSRAHELQVTWDSGRSFDKLIVGPARSAFKLNLILIN